MSNDAATTGLKHGSVTEQEPVPGRSPVPEPKLPFAFARKFGVVLVSDEQGGNPQACAKRQL